MPKCMSLQRFSFICLELLKLQPYKIAVTERSISVTAMFFDNHLFISQDTLSVERLEAWAHQLEFCVMQGATLLLWKQKSSLNWNMFKSYGGT